MDRELVYYFAYGSNMNPERMRKKNAAFFERMGNELLKTVQQRKSLPEILFVK